MKNKKERKVTLKDYGFIEWFLYHSENNTWTYFFIRLFVSCLTAFITALIVSNSIINSNTSSNISNQQRTENIQENDFKNVE